MGSSHLTSKEGTLGVGEHHTNNKVQTEAVMMTVTSPLGILALVCGAASQSQYGGGAGGRAGAGGGLGGGNGGSLEETIPGIPGEDYPIYSEVPETSFFCDGQVDGGYYGDPEAECQAFHICASDGNGGLTKYSFLCPNGTLFNQQYFVCDWWFNVDCSTTEDFYSLNDEIAAEREANSPGGGQGQYNGAGGGQGGARGGAGGRRGGQGGGQSQYQGESGAASFASPTYTSPQAGYTRNQREVSLEHEKYFKELLNRPLPSMEDIVGEQGLVY